jgi:hypothetical protein
MNQSSGSCKTVQAKQSAKAIRPGFLFTDVLVWMPATAASLHADRGPFPLRPAEVAAVGKHLTGMNREVTRITQKIELND